MFGNDGDLVAVDGDDLALEVDELTLADLHDVARHQVVAQLAAALVRNHSHTVKDQLT